MGVIITEGVLFVALLATGGALLYWILVSFTPVGVRLRQTQNRKRIDRMAEMVCPVHGLHTQDQLVRLAGGEQMCPDCYEEISNA
jgi:hypothetical protein